MISSKDREKLKVLLSDTITLLCKNGLEFSTDLNVEALIGITLDSQNVVLVSINETVGIDGKDSEEAMVGGSRDGDRTTTSTMVTKPAKRKVDVKEEPEEMEKETSPSAKCSASSTRQPDASAKSTDHRFPRTSSRQKKRKRVDNPNEVVAVDDDENSTEDVVYVKQEAEDGTWNVVSTIPSQGSMSDDNIQFSTGDRFASSALSSSSWQQETSSHTATSLQPHDTPQDTAPSTSATATVGTRYKEEQGDVASHEHSEGTSDGSALTSLGTPSNGQKHRSYSVRFKLSAIEWHKENGQNISRTSREFGVDRRRIRDWLAMEDLLVINKRGRDAKKMRLGAGAHPTTRDLDLQVLDWLLDERVAGRRVSNSGLKERALKAAHGIKHMERFKGSDGWLRRWKRRHSVAVRKGTNESQLIPIDHTKRISDFRHLVVKKRREWSYSDANIANMDEVLCRLNLAPETTEIDIRNERDGYDKSNATAGGITRGFTVCLTACANGRRLPAYIIFKEGNGIIPPHVNQQLRIPSNVRVTASSHGYMTSANMAEYLDSIWGSCTENVRRLFILDQARVHTKQQTREALCLLKTDVIFIPAGCTSIAQPADACWSKAFKAALREAWKHWKHSDLCTAPTVATRQDVIDLVSEAWNAVAEDIIVKSFKACGISTALDGSEDHLMAEGITDVPSAANNTPEVAAKHDLLFESDSDDANDEDDFEGFSNAKVTADDEVDQKK